MVSKENLGEWITSQCVPVQDIQRNPGIVFELLKQISDMNSNEVHTCHFNGGERDAR
jgi:hypothetical protein